VTGRRRDELPPAVRQAQAEARARDGRFGPHPRYERKTELGRLLVTARMRLGLRLQDVGEACGVTESAVSGWESGRLPHTDRLWRLCCVLQLPAAAVVKACDPRFRPTRAILEAQEGKMQVDDIVGRCPVDQAEELATAALEALPDELAYALILRWIKARPSMIAEVAIQMDDLANWAEPEAESS